MTIATQSSSIVAQGNGATTSFSFPFVADSAADIVVTYTDASGTVTTIPASQYTLTITPPAVGAIWGVGGTVVYPLIGLPIANGTFLTISRLLPYTQTITIADQGDFAPQVIEEMGDTLEMQIQQLAARTTQFRGIWLTATSYVVGDIVQDGAGGNNTQNYYICQIANTSGVWNTDLGAGDWAISVLATVPTSSNTVTLQGDIVGSGAISSPITTTLPVVNSNVGTFTNATVTANAKGQVTAVANGSASATGAMILLNSQKVQSSVSAVSVTTNINSSYSHYIWEISNIVPNIYNNGTNLFYITVQQNGSFIGGQAYNYNTFHVGGGAVVEQDYTSYPLIDISTAQLFLTSTCLVTTFEIWNPANATPLNFKFQTINGGNTLSSNPSYNFGTGVVYNGSATFSATTGLKLTLSSNSIVSCTANLYGVT